MKAFLVAMIAVLLFPSLAESQGCIDYSYQTPWRGGVDTPGQLRGVAVAGNYAYTADGNAGIQVIDITNPLSPQIVVNVDTPSSAFGVAISGNYAYVADYASGLQVIDIVNPTSPQIVGSVQTPGDAQGVATSGNYAYVALRSTGLQVIDITNPTSPQLLGSVSTSGAARGVSVSGSYAFIADGGSGLQVIDVTDPAAPQLVGSVDTPDYAVFATATGSYAYVADSSSGLQVIDITDPTSPQLLDSVNTPGTAWGVATSGSYAYVADRFFGIQVYDITDPSDLQYLGEGDTPDQAHFVVISGNRAYVADYGSGLQILPTQCAGIVELPYFEDFNDGIADGFTPVAGTWDIVNGEYHCLNEELGVKHISVVGESDWSDYRFDADLKTNGSLIQEMMVRYTDSGDWYLITVQPEPFNNILLHKYYNGTQTWLAGGPVPSHFHQLWHHMTIEVVGAEITASFDGLEVLNHVDETDPILLGKVGVVSFAYTDIEWQEAFFDNVSVVEAAPIELPYFEDFDDGIANGFGVLSGNWDVVDGEYHCLNQEPGVKQISIVGESDWTDYKVDLDVRVTGAPIQEFLVRLQSPEDWYVVTVLPEPRNAASLWKSTGGVQEQLLYMDGIFNEANVNHHMTVEVNGPTIKLNFDGEDLFAYEDLNSPYLTGKVGLVAFADQNVGWHEVFFDNVSIEAVTPVETPQITITPDQNDPIACDGTADLSFDYTPALDTMPLKGYSVRVVAEAQVTFSASDFSVNNLPPGEQVFYQVIENGENDFTLDYVILGSSTGGITTPESLFSLTMHGSVEGTAVVSILEAEFRDLDNLSIPVDYSGQAVLTVDCGPPTEVLSAGASPGHQSISLTWSDPPSVDLSAVLVFRGLWHDGSLESVYPGYGQVAGNTVPTQFPSYPLYTASAEWELAGIVDPGVGAFVDPVETRGIYFYQIFALDFAGNASPPLTESPAATNYILGDVAEPYDGEVGIADLSMLGDSYGVVCGDEYYNDEVDIGPTVSGSSHAIPLPDCQVQFEDLIIFSFNFGSPSSQKTPPPDCGELVLSWVQQSDHEWSCILAEPCPGLKGIHLVADDPGLGDAQVVRGTLLAQQPEPVFLQKSDSQKLDVGLAVMGAGQGFEGAGELFRISLSAPAESFNVTLEARSMSNEVMEFQLLDHEIQTIPTRYALGHNYPNPFNPSTTISYSLPEAQEVSLCIYGLDGRRIRTLASGQKPAGSYQIVWEGRDDRGHGVASGIYFYRLEAGAFSETRKMVLMK